MVITGRTRNAFVGKPARGFESLLLRQIKKKKYPFRGCFFFDAVEQLTDSNPGKGRYVQILKIGEFVSNADTIGKVCPIIEAVKQRFNRHRFYVQQTHRL